MGNKVFISYRREAPDDTVAAFLETELATAGLDVFRDIQTPIGARWAQEIQTQPGASTLSSFVSLPIAVPAAVERSG